MSRKYRPKTLDNIVGQDVLQKSLKNCLDSKKVPHAFLFHGIRGVGKTTSARILARCLSCIGSDGKTDITSNPCGICRSCIALDKDQHMDIMELDAASKTGIDDIREVIDAAQYSPVLGRYKIFIIDEVHMLSKSAFNALLKTLEEPPAHVKFIFATTEINKIPETILSRCMTFHLNSVSKDALSDYLITIAEKEGYVLEQDAAKITSEESEGSVRDALSILEQGIMMVQDTNSSITADLVLSMLGGVRIEETEVLLNLILNGNTKEALSKCEELQKSGADPYVLFKNLQSALYKMITEKVSGKQMDYTLSNLLYLWQIFLKQSENLRNASYPEYIFNAIIVILAHTASFPCIEKLMINEKEITSDVSCALEERRNQSLKSDLAEKVGNIINKEVTLEKDNSRELVGNILNKFPGSTVTEIE